MIVTLCQQIFFPTPNKFLLMRFTTTFSGLLMELKHEKFGQYPVFAKFTITQIITVANRSPHTTHTQPAIHLTQIHASIPLLQFIHSFIHHQPEHIIRLPHHIGHHLFGPAPASLSNLPFICALILIFSSTSSMLPHSLSQGQRQSWRLLPYCPWNQILLCWTNPPPGRTGDN